MGTTELRKRLETVLKSIERNEGVLCEALQAARNPAGPGMFAGWKRHLQKCLALLSELEEEFAG